MTNEHTIDTAKDPDDLVHDVTSSGDSRGRSIRTEWDGVDEPSLAIVKAIATATGRDPLDLPPLYDAIEPDALDQLISTADDGPRAGVLVSFRYADHTVTIEANGRIDISTIALR